MFSELGMSSPAPFYTMYCSLPCCCAPLPRRRRARAHKQPEFPVHHKHTAGFFKTIFASSFYSKHVLFFSFFNTISASSFYREYGFLLCNQLCFMGCEMFTCIVTPSVTIVPHDYDSREKSCEAPVTLTPSA